MNYAFPNGIPDYKTEEPIENVKESSLKDQLECGNSFFINTPNDSSYNDLDNKKIYIMEKENDGIWIIKPSSNINDSQIKFLFMKINLYLVLVV